MYPNQQNWPGQPSGPYRPTGGGRPPRHGLSFGVVAAIVIALAVTIGLVTARLGVNGPAATAPFAQRGNVAQPVASQSMPADLTAAAKKVVPGIALINTQQQLQGLEGAGTGIVLTSSGDVLTNNHVVEGATKIAVTDVGNGKTYSASVLGYDRRDDLAVIHLNGASGLTTAPLGDSGKVAVGDAIVGVGNAGGTGTPTAAAGRVTALNRSISASDSASGSSEQLTGLIQVAANIQPGDSGGPLVNDAGQVVGMDTAASQGFRFGTGGGQGFAIPIGTAQTIAKQIQSGTASDRVHIGPSAFLGVTVSDTNGSGALVRDVVGGGPAEQLGLAPGDTILGVDNSSVDSATTLTNTMDQHHPGDTVTVTWADQSGQSQSDQVRLAQGPVG
ncbi:S1C family serine protease [Nocardia terpenica]|uniref:S1C family serine protease n=1 Tax=Nocardia terpenica TaxID=455432 RepID=UPI0002D79261|nr:trypsin-like peptidase domain-containing protein [Nocardia terpenica]